jgi:hypothetical protein
MSSFLHKTIFFRWPYVLCCYKIQFKKFLDVDMTIFGICHHLGPFKKNVGMSTLPTLSCNVATSLYSCLGDDLRNCLYYWSIRELNKKSTDPCEAMESWNGSQFLDEQEAKRKWRHYLTVTILPHLTVRVYGGWQSFNFYTQEIISCDIRWLEFVFQTSP